MRIGMWRHKAAITKKSWRTMTYDNKQIRINGNISNHILRLRQRNMLEQSFHAAHFGRPAITVTHLRGNCTLLPQFHC